MKKEEFSQTILKVSKEIFARFGFQKTSMEMIAKSCGKAKSSIYYYYKSKEDIFEAVVENEAITIKEKITSEVCKSISPREKLKTYVLTRLNTLASLNNLSNALRNEYLSHLGFINEVKNKYRDQELSMVREILEEGKKDKKLEFDNVGDVAKAIVLAISGLELEFFIFPDEENLDDMETTLDLILNVFFKGLEAG